MSMGKKKSIFDWDVELLDTSGKRTSANPYGATMTVKRGTIRGTTFGEVSRRFAKSVDSKLFDLQEMRDTRFSRYVIMGSKRKG